MIEFLLYSYLLVGLVFSLVIWWVAFRPDYDQYVRDFFREEPADAKQKWLTIISAPILWPLMVWWVVRYG